MVAGCHVHTGNKYYMQFGPRPEKEWVTIEIEGTRPRGCPDLFKEDIKCFGLSF